MTQTADSIACSCSPLMNSLRSIEPTSFVIWSVSVLFRAIKSLASGRKIACISDADEHWYFCTSGCCPTDDLRLDEFNRSCVHSYIFVDCEQHSL